MTKSCLILFYHQTIRTSLELHTPGLHIGSVWFLTYGWLCHFQLQQVGPSHNVTVLPAMSDNDFMFCLQSYQGLKIDRSLVY